MDIVRIERKHNLWATSNIKAGTCNNLRILWPTLIKDCFKCYYCIHTPSAPIRYTAKFLKCPSLVQIIHDYINALISTYQIHPFPPPPPTTHPLSHPPIPSPPQSQTLFLSQTQTRTHQSLPIGKNFCIS